MTDISKEAVERLALHIQSTCGCALGENAEQPVAATLRALAAHIAAQDAKIAKLEVAIKRQASAAKTLRQMTLEEVQHLKDKDRSEYTAAKTVDSEREANAILTEELEERDAKIAKLVEVAHKVPERWAWGSGPNYQRRVCSDCGAIGELGSWDAPLPHNELCTYAQARQALASIGETND